MGAPLLALRRVTKTYGSAPACVTALQEVDLAIRGGEYLAVTGRSGSGKSTLLGILGLLMAPTTGEVLAGETLTASLGDDEVTALRAALVGFVFQQFHLVPHLTAVQNVETALFCRGLRRADRRARALEALDRVAVAERRHHRPTELSGGEQQRVAIARAVVARPRLLLADEPTGNLDTATGAQVMDVLEGLLDPVHALVVVTHDSSVAARASRRLELLDGRVASCVPAS